MFYESTGSPSELNEKHIPYLYDIWFKGSYLSLVFDKFAHFLFVFEFQ